jgi:hypothetical protein
MNLTFFQYHRLSFFIFFLFFISSPLFGTISDYFIESYYNIQQGHRFYGGPQTYYVQRNREGGTKQNGWLAGGKIGYDRFKGNAAYWCFEAGTASGTLKGKTGSGSSIKSSFTDTTYEWRLGYTFHKCSWKHIYFTPYLLFEYLTERNDNEPPSSLLINSKISSTLAGIGFLSQMDLSQNFAIGMNFSAKWMLYGKNRISKFPIDDDILFDDFTLQIRNEMHYRLEVPLTYRFNCLSHSHLSLSLIPFFEYRKYGNEEGFPINFLETKFKFYGAFFQLRFRI